MTKPVQGTPAPQIPSAFAQLGSGFQSLMQQNLKDGKSPFAGMKIATMDPATYALPKLLERYKELNRSEEKLMRNKYGARASIVGAPGNLAANTEARLMEARSQIQELENMIATLYGPNWLAYARAEKSPKGGWQSLLT